MKHLRRGKLQRINTVTGLIDAFGAAVLLQREKLGLICSRKCPGDIIVKTYDFVRFVRGSTMAILSGFHSPIEKDCLPILLRTQGLDSGARVVGPDFLTPS